MSDFKDFLLRGNLIELAVAVIIGGAFGTVVSSFTDLLMNIISKIFGGQPSFDAVNIAGIAIGPFITALVSFIMTAAAVYFFVDVPYTKAKDRFAKKDDTPAAPTEAELLAEIRDLLAERQ